MAGRKFGQGQETPLSWSLAEKEGESYLQREEPKGLVRRDGHEHAGERLCDSAHSRGACL